MPRPPSIPYLSNSPASHADSCLSLSQPLLSLISSLPPASNRKVLSIGSGSGLLESLLAAEHTRFDLDGNPTKSLTVHGVEPHPGLANKYLSADILLLVPGTWAVLPLTTALEYGTWLFVYPREKALVRRYIDALGSLWTIPGELLVVWAGPRVDWEREEGQGFRDEFEREFLVLRRVWFGADAGVAEWEMVVVFDWNGAGCRDSGDSDRSGAIAASEFVNGL